MNLKSPLGSKFKVNESFALEESNKNDDSLKFLGTEISLPESHVLTHDCGQKNRLLIILFYKEFSCYFYQSDGFL